MFEFVICCNKIDRFLTFSYADLEETLKSSFGVMDQSLLHIEDTASNLQYQCAAPHQQLNEIIVSRNASHETCVQQNCERKSIFNSLNRPQEQREQQRQALDDIRQEYEMCLQSVSPESLDDALSDIDENAYLNSPS